jgi:hypothetical protein
VDRWEPGSRGQRDSALVDQYFIVVTDCAPEPEILLSLGEQSDPVEITGGNIQIHPCK